ncbi:MAG: PQQ-dependent sugar dehydrogenase [Acidobacteriota bacterium]|nr:PQQ-dependent sugar dehydrogenase [Acidobacteriota bacterium]
MHILKRPGVALPSVFAGLTALLFGSGAVSSNEVLTGAAAFVSSTIVKPGLFRKITLADLPKPFATESVTTKSRLVPRPQGVMPQAPPSFQVGLFATGLSEPRVIRVAPNGDVFVVESHVGRVRVFRGMTADGKPENSTVFASGFHEPYGIVFYPRGNDPKWIYVANTDSVVRYAYINGDLTARGNAETVIAELPSSRPRDEASWRAYDRAVAIGQKPPDHGHWTRDLALSLDSKRLFVGVGSASNLNDPDDHPSEAHRADILEYTPAGKFVRVYASGIRNPSGIAVDPATGQLWCSVNERDGLGDNLAPDYITHVEENGFYGWPWFYLGSHQDPRLAGKHPELRSKVLTPDVLLQSHSASLQVTFYDGKQFPAEYRGDIFASQHGSWNRSVRSGYEVVRVHLEHGKADGSYEDFLTGFVTPNGQVWGRPVGVATAGDGSLLVSDDGSGSLWRVSYQPAGKSAR